MTNPRYTGTDGRTAMGRASDARPFKPYVYRGGDREPAAVTAVRQRHRELDAELERARTVAATAVIDTAGPGPDEAGYEWRREQLLEEGGQWPLAAAEDEMAELDAERDRYQAAMAAVPEPRAPEPPPVAAVTRCRRGRYLTTSAGHRVMCEE